MIKILLVSLVYNRVGLVGKAIQSAINQTYDKNNWRHLIVDNGSTDGADVVAEGFAKSCPHITLVRAGKNLGMQKAYNWVLNEWIPNNYPEAEVFAVLDSDDLLTPDALECVAEVFEGHSDVGETYSDFGVIDGLGNIIQQRYEGKTVYIPNQFTVEGQKQLRQVFVAGNPIGHQRSYRISCLRSLGGFDEGNEYANDYNDAGRMLERFKVVMIPKVLYWWRRHGDQIEGGFRSLQQLDLQRAQIYFKVRWSKMGLI